MDIFVLSDTYENAQNYLNLRRKLLPAIYNANLERYHFDQPIQDGQRRQIKREPIDPSEPGLIIVLDDSDDDSDEDLADDLNNNLHDDFDGNLHGDFDGEAPNQLVYEDASDSETGLQHSVNNSDQNVTTKSKDENSSLHTAEQQNENEDAPIGTQYLAENAEQVDDVHSNDLTVATVFENSHDDLERLVNDQQNTNVQVRINITIANDSASVNDDTVVESGATTNNNGSDSLNIVQNCALDLDVAVIGALNNGAKSTSVAENTEIDSTSNGANAFDENQNFTNSKEIISDINDGANVSGNGSQTKRSENSPSNVVCAPVNDQSGTDSVGDSNNGTDDNGSLNSVQNSAHGSEVASVGHSSIDVATIKKDIHFPNEPDLIIDVSDDELEMLRDVIAYDSDEDPEEMIEIEYNHLAFHPKRKIKIENDEDDMVTGKLLVNINVRSFKMHSIFLIYNKFLWFFFAGTTRQTFSVRKRNNEESYLFTFGILQ